jgi:zinc D-Ala-D-Ala carboxypeptidase
MFRYFTREEFDCRCGCGRNEIPDAFIHDMDDLREACGFSLVVNSGWRCKDHPKEAAKDEPGEHNRGAADVRAGNGYQLYVIQERAYELGFRGIAAGQGFVHVDRRDAKTSWVY